MAYVKNPEKKKEAMKKAYANDPEKFKEASKVSYAQSFEKRKEEFRDYYAEHREDICSVKRDKYVLCHPKEGLIKAYAEGLLNKLLCNAEIKLCLTMKLNKLFKSYTKTLTNKMKSKLACRLASKHLVHEILGHS